MLNDERLTLLVAEDSDEDFEMLTWAFAEARIRNPLVRVAEGGRVLPELTRGYDATGLLPGLILLDLNLIGLDGREVLRALKAHPIFRKIPVIVFSTSENPKDVEACYSDGASAYSTKPADLDRFANFARQLKNYWLEYVILPQPLARRHLDG